METSLLNSPFFKKRRVLPIEHYGSEVLRTTSEPVGQITGQIRDFAEQMIEAMFKNNGIGLAAPQVGRNIRLITLMTHTEDEELSPTALPGERLLAPQMPLALVNPEIVSASKQVSSFCEGCLSIPELNGDVIRPVSIVLRAQLLNGQMIETACGGLLARCLQHEIDHLNGVLFVDHLSPADKAEVLDQLEAIERRTLKSRKNRG